VSATSGLGDTTVVAAQVPISEANVTTTHEQIEVDGANPLLSTVSTTRLPATCTQAPVGSLQAAIPSSGEGVHQCISPRFTPVAKRESLHIYGISQESSL